MNKILTIILTLAILSQTVVSVTAQEATPGDVVDEASATGSHDTLVSALNHVNLEDTLRGDGPFTVFAPTDQALLTLRSTWMITTQMPKTRLYLTYCSTT